MASNVITPDKVKSVLSTFLSSNTKEKKSDTESTEESGEEQPGVLSPVEFAAKSEYFTRVETYSPVTWFGKPRELSPLVCARYGWENTKTDMLQCVSCRAIVCGHLPPVTDFIVYKEACNKLVDKLITGHEKICWLVANPTSEKYMVLPIYDVAQLRKEFHERLCKLATIKLTLPKLNFENLDQWGFDEGKCVQLAMSQNIREDVAVSATLAITGWTLSSENSKIVVCEYCKRRIGLWNYSTKNPEIESDKKSEEDEPPNKRLRLDKKLALDPIMEHRYWCPWVTMATKNSPTKSLTDTTKERQEDKSFMLKKNESHPGWVNTLQILVPDLAEKVGSTGLSKSPMIEGLRSVRKILRVWSSPEKPKPAKSDLNKKSLEPDSTTSNL